METQSRGERNVSSPVKLDAFSNAFSLHLTTQWNRVWREEDPPFHVTVRAVSYAETRADSYHCEDRVECTFIFQHCVHGKGLMLIITLLPSSYRPGRPRESYRSYISFSKETLCARHMPMLNTNLYIAKLMLC